MFGDPLFGILDRLIEPATLQDLSADDPTIDQEQEYGDPTAKGCLGPVVGTREIVLEMKACVSQSFFDQGLEVFVVAVTAIRGQQVDPLAR